MYKLYVGRVRVLLSVVTLGLMWIAILGLHLLLRILRCSLDLNTVVDLNHILAGGCLNYSSPSIVKLNGLKLKL